MKRKLLLVLTVLLPILANAYDAVINGIYYNFSGEKAAVTYRDNNYNSYSGTVVIPKSIIYYGTIFSVTSIDYCAFYGCTGLTSITIPNSVTSIGDGAFQDCTGLISISIPEGVTRIGESAFSGCSSLTSITIPNSVTSIDGYAFANCTGLTSVTIGNSVTSIDTRAFSGCTGLTSIKVESGNTVYDSRNNCNAIIKTASNALIIGCQTTIIPNSVTSIGRGAFDGCTGLTSINTGNGVTEIDCAFDGCTGLTSVTIGNSVIKIDEKAFKENNLRSVYVKCTYPPVIDFQTFNKQTYEYATLFVPAGCKNTYAYHSKWNKFINIRETTMAEDITISNTGYSSFFDSKTAYTLPNGVSAQVVTGVSNDKITYKTIANGSKGGVVPKGTAVLLVSDNSQTGNFSLTPTESSASYTGTNLLHGSDVRTTTSGDGSHYKLSYGPSGTAWDKVFGWYYGAQNGAPFVIEGKKAWLVVPGSPMTRASSGYTVEGDATDVIDIEIAGERNNVYYDLQGRRIGTPTSRGIYIKDGKKVFVK